MDTAITPKLLGLKHREWRENQEEAVDAFRFSEKRIFVLEAPPGSGKTTIGLGAILKNVTTGVIITATKSLQEQYVKEANGQAVLLKGRNNYSCILSHYLPEQARKFGLTEESTADGAPCTFKYDCPVKSMCPYYQAREKAVESPIVVLNYALWLHEAENFQFCDRPIMVLDEAHLIDSILTSYRTVELSKDEAKEFGHFPPTVPALKEWAEGCKGRCKGKVGQEEKFSKRWRKYTRLVQKFTDLTEVDSDAIITGDKVVPRWNKVAARMFIRSRGTRILMMSGTISPVNLFATYLGIEDYEYYELPWVFPAKNRPIVYLPAGKVSYKTKGSVVGSIAEAVEDVLFSHPNDRGLIHSVSFSWGKEVYNRIKDKARLIVHTAKDKEEKLRKFKRGTDNSFLISPSISHGEDFAYDMARVQVIIKVPMPSLAEEYIKVRMKEDQNWYWYTTAATIWQMVGRVCRAVDDYGVTYIVDGMFDKIVKDRNYLVPKGIKEALQC